MPDFRFSPSAGRYRGPNGRFLPSQRVRALIDRTLDTHTRAVADLTEQFRAREITLGQWEQAMRVELKHIHLYSGMAALGGRAQLTQADYGRIGAKLRQEFRWLREFADQIVSGRQPVDGRVAARARAYVQAGRSTFESIRQRELWARGFGEIRSLLHPADHCSECVAEAAKSWQPVGAMVPIGSRQCRTNCRCTAQLRNPLTGEIAA